MTSAWISFSVHKTAEDIVKENLDKFDSTKLTGNSYKNQI